MSGGPDWRVPVTRRHDDEPAPQLKCHERRCLDCGRRAVVHGPPDWTDVDIAEAFAEQGRSFSDRDPLAVACYVCARKRWAQT